MDMWSAYWVAVFFMFSLGVYAMIFRHNVVHLITSGKIDMVVNTPNYKGSRADGYSIRAATTAADLPIMTTIAEFGAAVQAIKDQREREFRVVTLQEHNAGK